MHLEFYRGEAKLQLAQYQLGGCIKLTHCTYKEHVTLYLCPEKKDKFPSTGNLHTAMVLG